MYLVEDGPEVPLEVDAIIDAAQSLTGLNDFADLSFKEGLQALIESFRVDVWDKLHPEVRTTIGRSLAHILEMRLRIVDDRKRFPEISGQKIKRPIFCIGMPRTSSTLLHTLLAQDPANVAFQLWESMAPSPPPKFGVDESRRARLEQIMRWHIMRTPEIQSFHHYEIEEGYAAWQECLYIGELSFAAYQPFGIFGTRSYFEWFAAADVDPAIAFHRKFLQHLQWGREGRTWVCKSVDHGIFLSALLKEYPDAVFIWTHRDPLTQAASWASTSRFARQGMLAVPGEPEEVGRDVVLSMKLIAERGMSARRAAQDRQFLDIYFPELNADPMGTVRHLYDWVQRPLTAEAQLRMEAWLRKNRVDRGGGHKYSVEEFGLTESMINEEMKDYLDWFGPELAMSKEKVASGVSS